MIRITPADRAIGTILPSSNRVVERTTQAVLASHPDIDACFARISYHGHGRGQPADGYDLDAFVAAGEMLGHAQVGVICWNGTRGAALGFEPDRRLCDRLSERTGLPAVTTALATVELVRRLGIGRVAIVLQGTAAEGEVIAEQFRRQGVEIGSRTALGITDNFAAARIPPATLARHVEAVAERRDADAVLIWSTNLPGHAVGGTIGRPLRLLDSATIGVTAALRAGYGIGVAEEI